MTVAAGLLVVEEAEEEEVGTGVSYLLVVTGKNYLLYASGLVYLVHRRGRRDDYYSQEPGPPRGYFARSEGRREYESYYSRRSPPPPPRDPYYYERDSYYRGGNCEVMFV